MPIYSYVAKNLKGIPKSGTIEAENQQQVARSLKEDGYILVSAKAEGQGEKFKSSFSLPFLSGVSLSEKMIFTRNLQVMVSAGVSLPNSLKILSRQSKSRKFKKVISEISEGVVKGENFSDLLTRHKSVFSDLYCNMVRVGEESGTMESVLSILTKQMEKEHELKSRIIGAMVYPAVILVTMMGIGVLMLILVIPKLAETFKDLGIDLPPTTRFVIWLGNSARDFWYLIPVLIFGVIFLFKLGAKTKIGKFLIDTMVLKIPVVSGLVKKTNSAYTVRTLGSLIASGVPITRALELVAGSLSNSYFKKAILASSEKIKKGGKLADALKEYEEKLYSSLVIQMIEIGEETGKTAEILNKLADFFEEEVANATKNLSAIIEPVMMVVIGAVVGFFVVSMIQPMYGMIQGMK
ncbi:MAG: type II secretion system F family protein [Candidatus Nealsonbacteria bacterium]|nr:type II secretion system F family protein [Candidatus Nealsonbacteria bacterium]